jgi:hypothetical protein
VDVHGEHVEARRQAGRLVAERGLEVVDLLSFIGRLIAPKAAWPLISAVGAVFEPLPSTSVWTLG